LLVWFGSDVFRIMGFMLHMLIGTSLHQSEDYDVRFNSPTNKRDYILNRIEF